MQALPIIQVDAFTTTPFGGHPCAVVFDADALSDETMQAIAREMNLAETAFVMDSEVADFRARYYTPVGDVTMGGHSTIATVYGLLASGRLRHDSNFRRVTLELPAGVVEVDVAGGGDQRAVITMLLPEPEFYDEQDRAEVAAAFGVNAEDLHPEAPVQTVNTGIPHLMVPMASTEALTRVQVDQELYARLREFGGFFSAHLFVAEGATERGQTFARHFGVPRGMPEEPFTGSATGSMAGYLWRHQLISQARFVAEQGHWMGRPGEADVEVLGEPGAIRGVRVGGHAVEIMQGMILAPDDTP